MTIHQQVSDVAGSPFVVGAMMLLLNIGSRFIVHEFSDNDEEYKNNIILRRLTVFAVCFVGTRDLITSLMLTASFVILASGFMRGQKSLINEGMTNSPDDQMRLSAGLHGKIDAPAYDKDAKCMF